MTAIANESMVLLPDDPLVVCTISVVGLASTTCKAGGSGVHKDNLAILVSAITYPSAGATIPDPSPKNATIASSAQKCKADNMYVLLEGDETATISATPQIPNSPKPIDYQVTFKVKIQFAGQIKVKGS